MSAPILLYLLKANMALLLFAAAYFGLLRRLTFFTLNRFYLVFALLFAAVYPALPVPALLPAAAVQPVVFVITEASGGGPAVVAGPAGAVVDWAAVGLALYAAGTVLLLGRLLVQLLSLWRLRRQSRPALVDEVPVRVLAGAVSPFSFGQTIYLNPGQHPAPELAAVLRHEQVHVRQHHTLDVLLAQLALAAAWCNPAAWMLRRAMLDNLEYLADHAVLQTGLVDRRAYQYSLLRLSHSATGPSLVSHFTFPTLKNRVAMMNTPFSSTGQLARYFVAGPLVLALALGFSAARAQDAKPAVMVKTPSAATNEPTLVYVDGQLSTKPMSALNAKEIASVSVLKGDKARLLFGDAAGTGVALITTMANQNRADVQAFNQKVAAVVAEPRDKTKPVAEPRPVTIQVRKDAQAIATAPAKPSTGTKVVLRNPNAPAPAYYVDGQLHAAGISDIDPKQIASVHVVKGDQTHQLFGDSGANGVVVITTTAKQHRADVQAFNASVGATPAPMAQSKPTIIRLDGKTPPPAAYYLDGQLLTQPLNAPNPNDLATVNVVKGLKAEQLFGKGAGAGVIILTTKANQNRADVVAFNNKAGVANTPVEPAAPKASVPYLAAPALAYITKNYPDARLVEMTEVPTADGKPSHYKALLAIGRRPFSLLFDERGQFISEVPSNR